MKPDAHLISPKQMARAIGVSESSLKRWCDQGLIPTVRTAGGHRKILKADALKFARENEHRLVSPEVLGLPAVSRETALGLQRGTPRMVEALLSGNELLARQVVFDLYLAGHSLPVLFDEVLAAAFREIGTRWECRTADVYMERRATEICRNILYEFRKLLPPTEPTWQAVGGTITGDHYTLPNAMTEIILREAGFAAHSLGTHLPFGSLMQAAEDQRPKLFWLSISHVHEELDFVTEFNKLSEACAKLEVPLVVGGRALTEALRKQLVYTAYCDNMQQLDRFARMLGSSLRKRSPVENPN